jgi:alpha-tubulin suppressor-like RCC1 family protein
MKKLLMLLSFLVAAFAVSPARAGTCNPSYADSLPQVSGTAGDLAANAPGQTNPGEITRLLATGDGFDVQYTTTGGVSTWSHISLGYGVSCVHQQAGGWNMPAPYNKLTKLKFEGTGFQTVVVINNTVQPMNVFECSGVEIRGEYGILNGTITKISSGPGTQDLKISGYDSVGGSVINRTVRAVGPCHLGNESHLGYDRITMTTSYYDVARIWAYGSGGITSVEFFVDGVSVGTEASWADVLGNEHEYWHDAPNVSVGWHVIKATASFSAAPGTVSNERRVFFNKTKFSMGENFGCVSGDYENFAGNLYCWGQNNYGQAGTGSTSATKNNISVPVVEGERPHISSSLLYVTDVSAGTESACAVAYGSTSGGVYCWGKNSNGVLSEDPVTVPYSASPREVFPIDSGATKVSVGRKHACALFSNGQVRCWGHNAYGQLGNGTTSSTTTPTTSAFSNAVDFGAGIDTTWVMTSAGEIWSFGRDNWGQLGDGSTLANKSTPVKIVASGATKLWTGAYHACALVSGAVKCWGSNPRGEIGDGTTSTTRPTPTTTTAWSGYVIRDMYLGDSVTCIVTTGGAGKCIGSNVFGNLGIGTTSTMEMTPTGPSLYASGVKVMSIGINHQCVFDGNEVYCHGDNTYNQISSGTGNPQVTPWYTW